MSSSIRALWRLLAIGATAVAALAVPASASAVTTAQTEGLAPILVSGGTDLGALPARSMQVTVALSPRNQAALDRVVRNHQTISSATYSSTYAPSQATVNAVRSWATSKGLSVSSVSANRTLVRLSGSSTALGRALGITFERYRQADIEITTASARRSSFRERRRLIREARRHERRHNPRHDGTEDEADIERADSRT